MTGKNRRTREPGVKSTPWTNEEAEALRTLLTAGATYADAARRMGRSRSSVVSFAQRTGLSLSPKKTRPKTGETPKNSARPSASRVKFGASRTDRGPTNTRPDRRKPDSHLPHLTTMQGQRLHVYPPDPYAREPLATYERHGDWWVRRGDPNVKFRTILDAVGAVSP